MDKGTDGLAAMLPFKITRLIQYGETKSMWELVLDDGSVMPAGSTSSMLSFRTTGKLACGLLERHKLPSARAQELWREMSRAFLNAIEREHRPRSEYRRKYGR